MSVRACMCVCMRASYARMNVLKKMFREMASSVLRKHKLLPLKVLAARAQMQTGWEARGWGLCRWR